MRSTRLLTVLLLSWLTAGTARADIIPIDLNDFFADPTVTVSADGSSASFAEDSGFLLAGLFNDPGFGDPEVIIAGLGTTLAFDFDFVEGAGNDDEFFAGVLGADGFSIFGFDFFTGDSDAGTISFDLSTLIGEAFLGFEFGLVSFDDVFDSTLLISNVRLETATAVPEPSALFLMLTGMLALLSVTRRRRRDLRST